MLYKYQHYIAKRSQRVSSNSDCLGKGTREATSLLFVADKEEAAFASSNSLQATVSQVPNVARSKLQSAPGFASQGNSYPAYIGARELGAILIGSH